MEALAALIGMVTALLAFFVSLAAFVLAPFYWAVLVLSALALVLTVFGRRSFRGFVVAGPRSLLSTLMIEVSLLLAGFAGVSTSSGLAHAARITGLAFAIGTIAVLYWPNRWSPARYRSVRAKHGARR